MKSINISFLITAIAAAMALGACSKKDNPTTATAAPVFASCPAGVSSANTFFPATPPTGANVMHVSVNGALCGNSNNQYSNEPCVSVTVCAPGTNNCQTINNILLDTGSYGLRLFSSVLTVPLTQVKSGTSSLAECVQFGDGSSEWGPVQTADVQLAGEPAVTVPIHVVNSTYAKPPGPCTSAQSTPDTGPAQSGFNGILGVGFFKQDCGPGCGGTNANNGMYYACDATGTCTGVAADVANQVTNPVAMLPKDNNGFALQLPGVPDSGASSVEGYLVLGIGTQTNNAAIPSTTTYDADGNGTYVALFSAASAAPMVSFVDSGSSILFFPAPKNGSLPDCGGNLSSLYCPSAPQGFTATTFSATGSGAGCVAFHVDNAFNLLSSNNMVFSNMAAGTDPRLSGSFDWGLPFFLGRTVYVGIENATSSLGTGPYWAY